MEVRNAQSLKHAPHWWFKVGVLHSIDASLRFVSSCFEHIGYNILNKEFE